MKLQMLRFDLPVPPKELHPNGRAHWKAVARHKSNYAEHARMLIRDVMRQYECPITRAVVKLEYVLPSALAQHVHDKDNLIAWAKTTIDCLEAEGVLTNDRHLRYRSPEQKVGQPNLRVLLFPLDGDGGQIVENIVRYAVDAFDDPATKAWVQAVMSL